MGRMMKNLCSNRVRTTKAKLFVNTKEETKKILTNQSKGSMILGKKKG